MFYFKIYVQMKQKFLFSLLVFGLTLTCCKSAKQLAMEGKYDKAFDKALTVLKKQPTDAESIGILTLAFENANERNLNRISQLQTRNSADRWMEIAELYKLLQGRQDKMRQILPFLPSSMLSTVKIYDYNNQLMNAQTKAADYNFERGMSLLNMNSKSRAREAVNYFIQARKYDSSDPEISRMIDEATFLGTNHVLYVVKNYTAHNLPYDYMTRMSQVADNYYLNSSWVKYYTYPEPGFIYDYVIELNFESINVVPERSNTKSSSYSKTVDDGWEYETDRRGNRRKDANGNDIKRAKSKQIRCDVIETTQTKSIFLNARLNYIHSKTNRRVRSIPLSLEQQFFHQYVTFRGDKNAIDYQVISKFTRNERPAPFPSVTELVHMSREKMAEMVFVALRDNDRLIRNSD